MTVVALLLGSRWRWKDAAVSTTFRAADQPRAERRDPALRARPVSAIAMRWGLTNPAHFSRAFRAAYGIAPAEYRRMTTAQSPW